jgi:hypothetical protein
MRNILVCSGLVVVFLGGCGKAIDASKIENLVKDAVVKEGGTSLKSVVCPGTQEAGKPLVCMGILDSGSGFDIDVQPGVEGKADWKVVSVKGLLNMMQVQGAIVEGLKKEVGEVSLDCQTTNYRAFKPGDTLECLLKKGDGKAEAVKAEKLDGAKAEKPDKVVVEPDKVLITMSAGGEVNWQRLTPVKVGMLPKVDDKSKSVEGLAGKNAEMPGVKDKAAKEDAKVEGSVMPPAAGTGEDALNQPGALDDFN